MTEQNIYREIAKRTGGDIYIGVVGPVRTGKSTFIRRFMERCVLPGIVDEYDKARTLDSMPQAASGKTVMTAEPKFIPDESVKIAIGDTTLNIKMVDCVGYLVPEALGQNENGMPRLVRTPWSESPIPFREAAELGTRKVICEHATIGILVTSDGTIGDFTREEYLEAEERVVKELSELGKPYAIVLNSARPNSPEAKHLAESMESKYKAPVALVNCLDLDEEDITHIMALILDEFPVTELAFHLPKWVSVIPSNHPLRRAVFKEISDMTEDIFRVGDIKHVLDTVNQNGTGRLYTSTEIHAGDGTGEIALTLPVSLFYQIMEELSGMAIPDEAALLSLMCELAETKRLYDKVADALIEVSEKGYGVVMPEKGGLTLSEPQLTKQAGGYGVKLRAAAKSIHMIRAEIQAEINPVVGTEEQAMETVKHLSREYREHPDAIWEFNLFGKSLYQLLEDGIESKMDNMPEESRTKMSETLERIINEGSGGLICILL